MSLSLLALRPVQQGELCGQRVGQGQVRFRRQVRVLHQQHNLVGMEVKLKLKPQVRLNLERGCLPSRLEQGVSGVLELSKFVIFT